MKDDVRWLDGQPATGKFVMRMEYANGGTAYMKNATYEGIVNHYNLLITCPDVVDAYIYNPQGECVNQMNKHRKAA